MTINKISQVSQIQYKVHDLELLVKSGFQATPHLKTWNNTEIWCSGFSEFENRISKIKTSWGCKFSLLMKFQLRFPRSWIGTTRKYDKSILELPYIGFLLIHCRKKLYSKNKEFSLGIFSGYSSVQYHSNLTAMSYPQVARFLTRI
jgi:hypothetical protein